MIAKILFLIVLITLFVWLWSAAARRVSTARVHIGKAEKPFVPDDKLAQLARETANIAMSEKGGSYNGLQPRLASCFAYITSVYRQLSRRDTAGETLPAAAEWILDNYYIVEKKITEIEESLTLSASKNISIVTEGEHKGEAAVYVLAREFALRRIGQTDEDAIREFLGEYTRHVHLSSDEIWLFFDMIKLVLIENIAYLCKRLRFCIKEYEYAKKYAAYVLVKKDEPEQMRRRVCRYFSRGRISKTFVSAFLEIMHREGSSGATVSVLTDRALRRRGLDSRQLILDEQAMQAQYQTSMGACIRTVAEMESMNLDALFNAVSAAVRLLKQDPMEVYNHMDSASQKLYQDELRTIANAADVSEDMAAEEALKLAQQGISDEEKHIGYYLLSDGRETLFKQLGSREKQTAPRRRRLYFAGIWGGALLFGVIVCAALMPLGIYMSVSFGFFAFLLATQPALEIANSLAAKFTEAKPLPKLKFEGEIPKKYSTLVVTTSLLLDRAGVDTLIDNMEDFYLLNREKNISFAILADYKDSADNAPCEDLRLYALGAVERLNLKYNSEEKRFFFLLRESTFCESEGRWMGAERKRGALCELVRFLKTGEDKAFIECDRELARRGIKYVITLDADTKLQYGSAARMTEAMAHPVNAPIVNEEKNVVERGYAFMQPKVGIDIESAGKTFYTRVYAAYGGLDIYSGASSDVYQDLFGEGIFVGKGIFDVDIFYRVLYGRFPDGRILSHDLLEGSYMRCALLSDTEVSDSYPQKYLSHIGRLNRWTRGDWQLLPWLGRTVPAKNGKEKNPLGFLARYKIFDNIRRSAIPYIKLRLLIASMFLPAPYSYILVSVTLLLGAYPMLYELFSALAGRLCYRVSPKFNAGILFGTKRAAIEYVINTAMLVYESYQMADAAGRTLWRLLVSKKHMLSWVTAADAQNRDKTTVLYHYKKMWISPAVGALLIAAGALTEVSSMPLFVLFGFLWIASPLAACEISRPSCYKANRLKEDNKAMLYVLARQMWGYFEEFSTAEHNYLVPDNVQMEPEQKAAPRTSPTNIGLLLASALCARDFGYISTRELVCRVKRTLDTIDKLKKWRGHLLNWYNTKTLEALEPLYVSTVDNGNYIADLILVRQGLLEYAGRPNVTKKHIEALLYTVQIACGEDKQLSIDTAPLRKLIEQETVQAGDCAKEIEKIILACKDASSGWSGRLCRMAQQLCKSFCEPLPKGLDEDIYALAERIDHIVKTTSFLPLYDEDKQLFTIGYDISQEKKNNSYYDLLMSEARQTSFIATARGEVGREHWFKLGRSMAASDMHTGLLSWTGTMFEYLMPLLLMKSYRNTIFDESYNFALREQMKYAMKFAPVYGISESGYYSFDAELNYAYKAFGVPVLGLKRGLSSERVIAPYASVMSAMLAPNTAAENMKKLIRLGAYGEYGFYEALDFTPRRLAEGEDYAVVKSFMVHHVGMSFLALDNVFFENLLQSRFMKEPFVRAGAYLLGERIPINPPISRAAKYEEQNTQRQKEKSAVKQSVLCERTYDAREQDGLPQGHILSNKNYMMYINKEGYGYSRLGGININRFTSMPKDNKGGFFVFVSDSKTNRVFPSAFLSGAQKPQSGHVTFSHDKALFSRRDNGLDTETCITVCPDVNAQIHKVTVTNHEEHERVVTLTFYTEAVLTRKQDDEAHRAFSGLFVSTRYDAETGEIIATRRRRFETEKDIWVCLGAAGADICGEISCETDREKFLGRNNTLLGARALQNTLALSGSTGAVLDPVLAMRVRICVKARCSASVSFILSAGETEEAARQICANLKGSSAVMAAFAKAQAYSSLFVRYLDLKGSEEERLLSYLPAIAEGGGDKTSYQKQIESNTLSKKGLWKFGISGDLPFVLVYIKSEDMTLRAVWAAKMCRYYNTKGFSLDVVLLCGETHSYSEGLLHTVRSRVQQYAGENMDHMFIINGGKVSEAEKNLLYTFCVCVLDERQYCGAKNSPLQIDDVSCDFPAPKKSVPIKRGELIYDNDFGGFDSRTGEYVITLKDKESTPMPWSNILANEDFGAVVTESGGGFCYSRNSALNKLTPWSNDAVNDPAFERIYICEDTSGYVFSPTRADFNQNQEYQIRHAIGYSKFLHNENALSTKLCVFVAPDAPVKVSLLSVKNTDSTPRELTLTYMIYPVLGQKTEEARFVTVRFEDGALHAKNVCNEEFEGLDAFAACSLPIESYTADAEGFDTKINGIPCAVIRGRLNGKTEAGVPPVLALQTKVALGVGETKQIAFLLGQAHRGEAEAVIQKYTNIETVKNSLSQTQEYWESICGGIKVKTPDASMDLMINGRLLYQTAACRLFSRCAFYQCGGAFGYRDQLQDVLALLTHSPKRARRQILLHAAHQFEQGDVLHWWHSVENGSDRGVRTRFSDDLLWLAYVALEYIDVTGDKKILDEQVPFVTGALLGEGTDEMYYEVGQSQNTADLYTHIILALRRALRFGSHGLVLMGSGDWNDGMNAVGNKGKGESVWLSWFVCDILARLSLVCKERGEKKEAEDFLALREKIALAIDKNAWDGDWYVRAFFDDGSPLGSHTNGECKIDAIAQAWSVISRAGAPDKAKQAMESVKTHLVSKENGLIALLTPAFKNSDPSPGYIQSYAEGVRENGGQYTHAAVWVVIAAAMIGDRNSAYRYFCMLNPINHTQSEMETLRYKNEPYALSADVYTNPKHMGRAGWSFYTGAAGWYYKAGTEYILGMKKRGERLYINPCVPDEWEGFSAEYRFGQTVYKLEVKRDVSLKKGETRFLGKYAADGFICLEDCGGTVEAELHFN